MSYYLRRDLERTSDLVVVTAAVHHVEDALHGRQELRCKGTACGLAFGVAQLVHDGSQRIRETHGIADRPREREILRL